MPLFECRSCANEIVALTKPSRCPACDEPASCLFPTGLGRPAPTAIAKHERRASRETSYKKASAAIRVRDGFRCRLCGDHRNLETHHVEPRSRAGKAVRDSEKNLITLCASCHRDCTEHIVKLYPGPDGANGLVRVTRYDKHAKDYLEVRKEA